MEDYKDAQIWALRKRIKELETKIKNYVKQTDCTKKNN